MTMIPNLFSTKITLVTRNSVQLALVFSSLTTSHGAQWIIRRSLVARCSLLLLVENEDYWVVAGGGGSRGTSLVLGTGHFFCLELAESSRQEGLLVLELVRLSRSLRMKTGH